MRAKNLLASTAVAALAVAALAGCAQSDTPSAPDAGSDERGTLTIATIMR